MATAEEIVRSAMGEIGHRIPSNIVNALDAHSLQVATLLARTAHDLLNRCYWPDLVDEAVITTVTGDDQGSVLDVAPAFHRIVSGSVYNRTQAFPIKGPVTPKDWQRGKAGRVPLFVGRHWRTRGKRFLVFEQDIPGETIAFEYVRDEWLLDGGSGEPKARLTLANDDVVLDEQAMILGLQWRYLEINGLSYGERFREYEMIVKARSDAAQQTDVIDLTPGNARVDYNDYPHDLEVKF